MTDRRWPRRPPKNPTPDSFVEGLRKLYDEAVSNNRRPICAMCFSPFSGKPGGEFIDKSPICQRCAREVPG